MRKLYRTVMLKEKKNIGCGYISRHVSVDMFACCLQPVYWWKHAHIASARLGQELEEWEHAEDAAQCLQSAHQGAPQHTLTLTGGLRQTEEWDNAGGRPYQLFVIGRFNIESISHRFALVNVLQQTGEGKALALFGCHWGEAVCQESRIFFCHHARHNKILFTSSWFEAHSNTHNINIREVK